MGFATRTLGIVAPAGTQAYTITLYERPDCQYHEATLPGVVDTGIRFSC